MPFTLGEEGHPPRRNTRSLDLSDSAAKAAAWVWHMHDSKPGFTTEGRFISSQSRRRNSSSYDRKGSRFQQEAALSTASAGMGGMKFETPMWDCGSKLYDTFELVSFGNRLDRSLMGGVPVTPHVEPHKNDVKSPLHQPSRVLRTLSLPRSLPWQTSKGHRPPATTVPNSNRFMLSNSNSFVSTESAAGVARSASTRWASLGKFMKAIKKVVVLHKQVTSLGCNQSTNIVESSQRPLNPIQRIDKESLCTDDELLINGKIRANLCTKSEGSECISGELSSQYFKVRSISESIGDKYFIHDSQDTSKSDELSMHKKIRSNSESTGDGFLKLRKINTRRKSMGEELSGVNYGIIKDSDNRMKGNYSIEGANYGIKGSDNWIKGKSADTGVNVRQMIKQQNEGQNPHYKHLHHHHHHHHHHFLHHNLTCESARLSSETMSQICAEESWLV